MTALELQPFLIEALMKAQVFVGNELEVMEKSFLPEPNEYESDTLTDARSIFEAITNALNMAAGAPEAKEGKP
jgi:hypothetical protein